MRLPKLFSPQNNTRFYKLKIKGNTGVIIFSELVKRTYITDLLIKNLKKSKVDINLAKELDFEAVRVVTDPKQLSLFQPMFKSYVDNVRHNVNKKNISIVNYNLTKITISPRDSVSLSIESEVDIEVAL